MSDIDFEFGEASHFAEEDLPISVLVNPHPVPYEESPYCCVIGEVPGGWVAGYKKGNSYVLFIDHPRAEQEDAKILSLLLIQVALTRE